MLFDRNSFSDGGLQNTNVAGFGQLQSLLSTFTKMRSYPFNNPPSALANKAIGRLCAKPKRIMLKAVPTRPVSNTGFRPILSLSLPHGTPAENSANANAEVTNPTYKAC